MPLSNMPKRIKDKIKKNYVDVLRDSNFYQLSFRKSIDKCLQLIEGKIGCIICYGLGSFSDGIQIAPRYQLAMLILIHEHLVQRDMFGGYEIEAFDPSFEIEDEEALASFREPTFKIISQNEYCSRIVSPSTNTLVYMPHLDKYLYNNLIGSNWTIENLRGLIVLGNSFQEMIDHEMGSTSTQYLYFLHKLVHNFRENPDYTSSKKIKRSKRRSESYKDKLEDDSVALIELPIDDSTFEHSDIFNSFSFHMVCRRWLSENGSKIAQTHLKCWTPATTCTS